MYETIHTNSNAIRDYWMLQIGASGGSAAFSSSFAFFTTETGNKNPPGTLVPLWYISIHSHPVILSTIVL
jgi:hypothetical protein